MGSFLGRRGSLAVIAVAGALFFGSLGFFLATGIDRPTSSRAENLWTEGTGLTPEMRSIPSFAPIADRMKPTVVFILVKLKPGAEQTTGTTLPSVIPDHPGPGQPIPDLPGTTTTTDPSGLPQGHPDLPPDYQQTAEGSGVVISKDGYILTNRHVIDQAESVSVTLTNGDEYTARVVGADARDDLALIKIDPKQPLTVAPLGDSEAVEPGDWVMAMGNPLGFEYSVTVGVVSGKGRSLPQTNFGDFIQTDAAIYPGNSGGPLFDLAGEVIGINTAVIPDTNLGFAVPIDSAKEILPQLLEKGKVVRGYLGVSINSVADMTEPPKGADKGAVVMEVHPGTPAAQAGVKAGDVVVTFDGKPVATAAELTALVTRTSPGARVTLGIVRDGSPVNVNVVVGALPTTWE
jgi:Trypsin-like serine proteases, typically periplasmic, contain C-terminal PDZ domain